MLDRLIIDLVTMSKYWGKLNIALISLTVQIHRPKELFVAAGFTRPYLLTHFQGEFFRLFIEISIFIIVGVKEI